VTERMSMHWFLKSQWSFLKREQYEALQRLAEGKAFTKPYADLLAEKQALEVEYTKLRDAFYASRAYFDNAHESMTEVWQASSPVGDDRPDHPTPKPLVLMERILKTSSPTGAVVLDPFVGSGRTIIAAEKLGRLVRGIELKPEFCSVTLQCFFDLTGDVPQCVENSGNTA
jgi:hypothetical protein